MKLGHKLLLAPVVTAVVVLTVGQIDSWLLSRSSSEAVAAVGDHINEVRSLGGLQAVARGQIEAAAALGLNPGQSMRLVTLPQALRVIIPPMTNQFLNLTKNSSLAVAIGYPDVVSIANTALNQTGRAVECIAIVMLVYLTTSLSTSLLMNWYNARSAIQER